MRWVGHGECTGEVKGADRVLVGKPEGRRPLGRPRRRWEDNIKVDLQEMGWRHGLDWSGSEWGQVAVSCECSFYQSGSIKYQEFLD